jgi:homoserine O-acetyltransferase
MVHRANTPQLQNPQDQRGRHLHVVGSRPLNYADGELQVAELGPVDLELGGHLENVNLAFRSWGRLNEAGDNAILILHALTGDSLAAGEGGWWEPVIGNGRSIDTNNHFVICANVLGGCQGSTGPSSINPKTGVPYATSFPLITIGDIVATQRRLVEQLGITGLIAIGGSIGGFQALEWATRHPDLVRATGVIAAAGNLGAQGIAIHGEVGRRAIMADPNWRGGNYQQDGVFPENGLAIARMAAMVTYHSRESLDNRFGRNLASRPVVYPAFGPTFDVEGYLHYHGQALTRRFDANSYLYLTRAMDLYDVARDGGEEKWLRNIKGPVLTVGISSDWLFPAYDVKSFDLRLRAFGADSIYHEIDSIHGHDSFLKDWDQLTPMVRTFIDAYEALRESVR